MHRSCDWVCSTSGVEFYNRLREVFNTFQYSQCGERRLCAKLVILREPELWKCSKSSENWSNQFYRNKSAASAYKWTRWLVRGYVYYSVIGGEAAANRCECKLGRRFYSRRAGANANQLHVSCLVNGRARRLGCGSHGCLRYRTFRLEIK